MDPTFNIASLSYPVYARFVELLKIYSAFIRTSKYHYFTCLDLRGIECIIINYNWKPNAEFHILTKEKKHAIFTPHQLLSRKWDPFLIPLGFLCTNEKRLSETTVFVKKFKTLNFYFDEKSADTLNQCIGKLVHPQLEYIQITCSNYCQDFFTSSQIKTLFRHLQSCSKLEKFDFDQNHIPKNVSIVAWKEHAEAFCRLKKLKWLKIKMKLNFAIHNGVLMLDEMNSLSLDYDPKTVLNR